MNGSTEATMLPRLTKTNVIELFRKRKDEIDGQLRKITEHVVSNLETQTEAENYLRLLKDSKEYLEKTEQMILIPYLQIIEDVKEAIKEITEKITVSDKGLRERIMKFQTTYASTQMDGISGKYENEKKAVLNAMELNTRVNIIGKQFYARLFGGLGPKLDGSTSPFPGLHSFFPLQHFP